MTITKKLAATLAFIALAASSGSAQPTSAAATEKSPWLNMEADLNFDVLGKSSQDYEATMRVDASLKFEFLMHEGVKAVVKARLLSDVMRDGNRSTINVNSIDEFLEEAYIQIETDKISGMPRAIIMAGKGQMAFGQDTTDVPMYRSDLLYNLQSVKEVVGLTVTLPVNFLKIVDSVALSIYENGPQDLKIADRNGLSVQLRKQLSQQIAAQVSVLVQETSAPDKEIRTSFGVVYQDTSGRFKVWAQGLVFDHNPIMPDTKFGGQLGGSAKLGPGSVVIQYEELQKHARELVAAYNLPVGEGLIISPEFRYTKNTVTNSDDKLIGVRARVLLDRSVRKAIWRGNMQ